MDPNNTMNANKAASSVAPKATAASGSVAPAASSAMSGTVTSTTGSATSGTVVPKVTVPGVASKATGAAVIPEPAMGDNTNNTVTEAKSERAGFAGIESTKTTPENIMDEGNKTTAKKTSKGVLLGMILCVILAAGGVGFGVWSMMDGNQQKEQLNSQVSNLKAQIAKLQEETEANADTDSSSDATVVVKRGNPLIKSSDSSVEYSFNFESSLYRGSGNVDDGEKGVLSLHVKNGKVESCNVLKATTDPNVGVAYVSTTLDYNCEITGLNGEIFDVIEIKAGHVNDNSLIGFIMTDGTVQYFPLFEAMRNKTFAIKGKLPLEGFVTGAKNIAVSPTDPDGYSGWASTVFIMDDGRIAEYNPSMIGE